VCYLLLIFCVALEAILQVFGLFKVLANFSLHRGHLGKVLMEFEETLEAAHILGICKLADVARFYERLSFVDEPNAVGDVLLNSRVVSDPGGMILARPVS